MKNERSTAINRKNSSNFIFYFSFRNFRIESKFLNRILKFKNTEGKIILNISVQYLFLFKKIFFLDNFI